MLEYLKDHIIEEIDGALDYMSKAVEYKTKAWGQKFYSMSMMELEHANCLTKMFIAEEKPEDMTDAVYVQMQKSVLDTYSIGMGKIESMKKLYWNV